MEPYNNSFNFLISHKMTSEVNHFPYGSKLFLGDGLHEYFSTEGPLQVEVTLREPVGSNHQGLAPSL